MNRIDQKDDDLPQQPARRSRWRRWVPSMGWASFFNEIVIVVVGVLIALGATSALEEWNWHVKVRDGEDRLGRDVVAAYVALAEQVATAPCIDAQLADLADRLLKSGETLTPAPLYEGAEGLRYVARWPSRPYEFPVWESLLADGTVAHFPEPRQVNYAAINSNLRSARDFTEESTRALGYLTAMAYAIPLDAGVRKDLLAELELQRGRVRVFAITAQQTMGRLRDTGSAPPDAFVTQWLEQSGTVTFCREHDKPLAEWLPQDEP